MVEDLKVERVESLREKLRDGIKVELDQGDVIYSSGDASKLDRIEGSCSTNYRSRRGAGEPYSLDAIVFFAQNGDRPFREYAELCTKQSVPRVQLIDAKELLAFLRFETNSAAGLVASESKDEAGHTGETVNQESAALDSLPKIPDPSRPSSDVHKRPPTARSALIDNALPESASGKRLREPSQNDSLQIDSEYGTIEPLALALSRELEQRSRDSILSMHGRTFKHLSDRVNVALLNARKEQDRIKRGGAAANVNNKQPTGTKPPDATGQRNGHASAAENPIFDPRGDRYAVKEDRFWRETLGTDVMSMGIDTAGGFKRSRKQPAPSAAPLAEGLNSVAPSNHAASNGASRLSANHTRRGVRRPILIVPDAVSAMFGMDNIREFLEEGRYVKRNSVLSGRTDNGRILIVRNSTKLNRTVPFIITDAVSRISAQEWDDVVAVIVTGAEWQFKKFPKPSSLESLKVMKGFHFRFDDEPVDRRVAEWRVQQVTISRTKRYLDMQVVSQFWDELDQYIRTNLPWFVDNS
uniref:Cell division control protein 73 C-terminal domain-containing protein n=1 Tax=Timspurckia oligopyrenoides TaxID=708627 RepID=A0A7S1ESG0_9RHOD|mmetsp:Transcript_5031/g.8769  ORF Transcript_5031/g.8769 Transcript_5031/m.8769 type:complete len:525 (+) Transcript_5031:40-1614(+)